MVHCKTNRKKYKTKLIFGGDPKSINPLQLIQPEINTHYGPKTQKNSNVNKFINPLSKLSVPANARKNTPQESKFINPSFGLSIAANTRKNTPQKSEFKNPLFGLSVPANTRKNTPQKSEFKNPSFGLSTLTSSITFKNKPTFHLIEKYRHLPNNVYTTRAIAEYSPIKYAPPNNLRDSTYRKMKYVNVMYKNRMPKSALKHDNINSKFNFTKNYNSIVSLYNKGEITLIDGIIKYIERITETFPSNSKKPFTNLRKSLNSGEINEDQYMQKIYKIMPDDYKPVLMALAERLSDENNNN